MTPQPLLELSRNASRNASPQVAGEALRERKLNLFEASGLLAISAKTASEKILTISLTVCFFFSGLVRALEVYSPSNPAAAKWRLGLRSLSIYQQSQLEKTVRDYTKLYSVQHSPPNTTLTVRWRNNGAVSCYTEEALLKIFNHFGPVRKISFQSECSAHVVMENVESACAALSLSNLGFPRCPLHVRWLPEEKKRLLWKRKDSIPNSIKLKFVTIDQRGTGSKEQDQKGAKFKSLQALTRPSQVSCTPHTKSRTWCNNC